MKNEILRQANAITESRHDLDELEKSILYLLMRELKNSDAPEKEYVIQLSELKNALGDISRKELKEATNRLISRTYDIKKGNGRRLLVSLMTVVKYDARKQQLFIKISQKILPYFVALKEAYTEFQLDIAMSLKGKYAKRIYEMLSQHKERGFFDISIKELKWRLAINDSKKGKDKYPSFTNFESAVLTTSQKEINEKSDLNFTYEATKTGSKYTHLHFTIEKEQQRQLSIL